MYCSDETVKYINKPTSSSYEKNLSEVVICQTGPVKGPTASHHIETYSKSVTSKEDFTSKSPDSMSKKALVEAFKEEYSLPSESLNRPPDTPHMEVFEDIKPKGYAMDKEPALEISSKSLSFKKHSSKMDKDSVAKISLDMCEKKMALHPERESSSSATPVITGREESFTKHFSSKDKTPQSSELFYSSTAVSSIQDSTVTSTMSTFETSEKETQVNVTGPHEMQSFSEESQPEKDNTFEMSYMSISHTSVKSKLPKDRLEKSVLAISQQKSQQTVYSGTSASYSAETGAKEIRKAIHFPDDNLELEPVREKSMIDIVPSSQQKRVVKQSLTTPDSHFASISKHDQDSPIQQIPSTCTTDISKHSRFDSRDSQSHTAWPGPSQVLECFSGESYKETYPLPKPVEASQQMLTSEPISDIPLRTSDTSDPSHSIELGFQQRIDRPGQKSEMVVEKTLMKILPSHDSGVRQERTFLEKSIVTLSKGVQEGFSQQGPRDYAVSESASKESGWSDTSQEFKGVFGKSITRISQSSQQDGNVQQQTASVAKSIVSLSGKTFPQPTIHETSVAHRELQEQTDSMTSPPTGYPQSGRDGQQTVIPSERLIDLPYHVHSVKSSKGRSSMDILLHDAESQKQISVMPDKVRKKDLLLEDSPERIHASESYTEEIQSHGSACQQFTPLDKLSTNLKSEIGNLSVEVHDMAQFTCKFDDSDFTEITWYHNGTKLIDTDRVRLTQNGGEVTLTIWKVQPEDQGTYSCMVKNRQGEGRTSARLTVEGGYNF